MSKLPLEGIRALDFTVVWAGPEGTMFLGDLGAEVIKVENLQRPGPAIRIVPWPREEQVKNDPPIVVMADNEIGKRPWNRSQINAYNRNKLSMTVNFRTPRGLDIVKKLVKVSDLILDNNTCGTLESWGLGWDVVSKINPRIIMLCMPGYGNTGPLRDAHLFGRHLEAMFGHSMIRGYRDLSAIDTPFVWQSDASGGQCLAIAAMMAIYQRNRTGKGQFVDLALGETMLPHIGEAIMDYAVNKRVWNTLGNRHASALQGTYRCQGEDNWVNIAIFNDEQWNGLCKALGNPAWTREPRFADVLSRYQNHDEIDKLIEAWTMERSHYEAKHALQKEGVPAGAILSTRDCYEDPHLKSRGFFEEASHTECGKHRYPGIPWKMSKTPCGIQRAAPCLGEHNEYIYKKVLGISDAEYAELEKEGHIGMDYPDSVLPRPK